MAKLIKGVNDLATTHPELAKEWDYEANKNLQDKRGNDISTPDNILRSLDCKVWWQCKHGHHWLATPADRVAGRGCPYCAGLYAITGKTDLMFLFPEIADEWHQIRNAGLTTKLGRDISTPDKITPNSRQKVWWKCSKCGYEWEAPVTSRTHGQGCPECSKLKQRMESNTSFSEQSIYYYIKKYFNDALNDNRTVLEGKELDVFIPSLKTGIEYDGSRYHKNIKKDIEKNNLALGKGVNLIRIREKDCPVLDDNSVKCIIRKDKTIFALEEAVRALLTELNVNMIDVDINRDYSHILNQINLKQKENSLAVIRPEIAAQWHPTKNGKVQPNSVTYGSSKKVWWICPVCGHGWQSSVANRTSLGRGCPKCAVKHSGSPSISLVDIQAIVELLKTTRYTCAFIGEMFGVSSSTISQINVGFTHYNPNEKYPIRKTRKSKSEWDPSTRSYCQICGKQLKERDSKYCPECWHALSRKALRPSPIELAKMILDFGFVQTGKHFGVSDNAIKKWCKQYGMPYLKNEIKNWYDEKILLKNT